MDPIIFIIFLALVGYALASAKMVNQGNAALVERLGRYHRQLNPGLSFIVPIIDQIVMENTTREQLLDIKPQNVITKDGIYLEVDAILYWRIQDIKKSFYAIDDLEQSLANIATTTLRENIAQNSLKDTNMSRAEMDKIILVELNSITFSWGVETIRLDIQSITPPETVRKSMEEQQNAQIKKQAVILAAEGEEEAAERRATGTKRSIEIISEALRSHPESKDILRYLVAQDYVDASQKLGESNNAKIVFVDPANSTEMFQELISDSVEENYGKNPTNGNGNGSN
ncbi:SPFH domain-containing protein [Aphanizomenon flos-aquae NRERC-008]|jgi:regulator of protease activity HflC (stomatin/prohibitin superfamily)|uniref:Membrane protease subunit, stomatin/prohibitin n=3 Tax=Aphanizomenon flos-aquae TaxID=1176 RepID=A0A1B7X4K9_APHFL|nr:MULTISPECIES: SPFH domain-containing protein [Aphanizomenon]MBD1217833.1 SPFH/Band 7/PHB domain protein [Aphanizomenon flos-aquae Clear-A1]MBO1046191.1 SPFH/Band 7/PHB domain protein [Aphanizomenon flos-aquae UKL13-PB]MBO1061891.1 SPFH/Band 7/PHB domain protein [Aphanizomenon flos-aquae CP01]MCE2905878.1 SPFH/Band 7/PHB domain protein [Anabaena sp. CoA2_C59]MDJ0506185.1 SPFH domain-containing protein [Nostocales cyanobacterium LE14-WE12]OBQ20886.1 MAG: membrane protease subunit, stomatin/p